jgi:hypothetical protein
MRYRNAKTGATITSPCKIKGENWVKIIDEGIMGNPPGPEGGEEVVKLSEMTVESLKKFAAENEIDLGKAIKKDDIIEVIMASDAVEVE